MSSCESFWTKICKRRLKTLQFHYTVKSFWGKKNMSKEHQWCQFSFILQIPTPWKTTVTNLFCTLPEQRSSLCCRIPAQKRKIHKHWFLWPHMYKQESVRMGDVHDCAHDVLVGVEQPCLLVTVDEWAHFSRQGSPAAAMRQNKTFVAWVS